MFVIAPNRGGVDRIISPRDISWLPLKCGDGFRRWFQEDQRSKPHVVGISVAANYKRSRQQGPKSCR